MCHWPLLCSLMMKMSSQKAWTVWVSLNLNPRAVGSNLFWVVVSNICYFHPYLRKWSNLTKCCSNGLKPPGSVLHPFIHPFCANFPALAGGILPVGPLGKAATDARQFQRCGSKAGRTWGHWDRIVGGKFKTTNGSIHGLRLSGNIN